MAHKENKKTVTKTILPLKDMNLAELTSKARLLYTDISKKKLEKTVGRLKNAREIFTLRKTLARVKTFISIKSKV
jgi:ribosomal protein L29